jgi:hypothetical protein
MFPAVLRRLGAMSLMLPCLACREDAPTGTVVSTGTLAGIPFTVASGQVTQASPDGPIVADGAGAVIVLDESPAELGMSNPNRLHLLTLFALQHGGTLTIGAFGTDTEPFGPGTAVVVGRNGNAIDYAFYVYSAVVADSSFFPGPPIAAEEQWVVTEFYADSVPGYGAGSGLTMWQLNELDPVLGNDVLGCTDGPAMSAVPMTGDRVAYRLTAGFLLGITVTDTIVGPCV